MSDFSNSFWGVVLGGGGSFSRRSSRNRESRDRRGSVNPAATYQERSSARSKRRRAGLDSGPERCDAPIARTAHPSPVGSSAQNDGARDRQISPLAGHASAPGRTAELGLAGSDGALQLIAAPLSLVLRCESLANQRPRPLIARDGDPPGPISGEGVPPTPRPSHESRDPRSPLNDDLVLAAVRRSRHPSSWNHQRILPALERSRRTVGCL